MELTVDSLKQMSTQAVTLFNKDQTTLSIAVAKVAEQNELNPEQIKRLIEASNQIAHLSRLAMGADRTSEFPVADYDEVIGLMLNTSDITPGTAMEKSASVKTDPLVLVARAFNTIPQMEKVASEHVENLTERERMVTNSRIQKEYMSGMTKLAGMIENEEALKMDLISAAHMVKLASESKDDSLVLEKLAHVSGADYASLCSLALGHVKEANEHLGSFDDKALSHVKSLHDLYTMSKQAMAERKELQATLEKAAEYLSLNVWGLDKSAFIMPALRAAASVLKSKAPAIGASTAKIGKRVGKVATGTMAGAEIAEISQKAKPNHDVWKSLHG